MKILIVDDERATRDTLHRFVDWNRLGISVVETAANGLEALDKMAADPAGIVLTDVRMPKMDGMEFSRKVRELYPDTSIVFLSGYSERDYLKSAIQVQAVDFIDKPLNLDEVQKVLGQAVEAQLKLEGLKRNLEDVVPVFKQTLLEGLLAAPNPLEAEENLPLPALREELRESPVRSAVGLPRWNPGTDLKTRLETIADCCKKLNALKHSQGNLLAAPFKTGLMALVVNGNLTEEDTLVTELGPLLANLGQDLPPLEGFYLGLAPAHSLTALAPALVQAETAAQRSFYYPEQDVFPFKERGIRLFSFPADWLSRLRQALETQDSRSLIGLISELEKTALTVQDSDVDNVRLHFSQAASEILQKVPGWSGLQLRVAEENTQKEMDMLLTLADCTEYLQALVRRHFDQQSDDFPLKGKIDRARDFIAARYGDHDLSIDKVARHVDLSEAYLCTVFKQGTGVTVHDFITQTRVEKAKELLTDQMLTLQSIAWSVGFRDPNYFGTVFRKVTGTAPGQYRRSLRR